MGRHGKSRNALEVTGRAEYSPHSAPASPTSGERRRLSATSIGSGAEVTDRFHSDYETYSGASSGSSQSINKRFGTSTSTSSVARPLAGNLVRNNTDLGFSGPILKYERFDPPPVNITNNVSMCDVDLQQEYSSNVSSNEVGNLEHQKTIGCENLNPLDLNLLSDSDLQDIIYRKTSPLESVWQLREAEAPAVTDSYPSCFLQSTVDHTSDLIRLNSNGDGICQTKFDQKEMETEVIFDPLLQTSITSQVNTVPHDCSSATKLPRPPSKSSIQQIARNHNLQQQQDIIQLQHKPLTRTMVALQTNPFSQATDITDVPFNTGIHKSDRGQRGVPLSTRQIYSKSSENLLKEYGLDFSKLSITGNGDTQRTTAPSNNFQSQPQPARLHHDHITAVKGNADPFADLDPLGKQVLGDPKSKPTPPPRPSHPPPMSANPPPRPSNPPPTRPNQTNTGSNTTTHLVDLTFAPNMSDPLEIHSTSVSNTMSSSNIQNAMTNSHVFEGIAISAPPPPTVPPRIRKSQNSTKQSQTNWTTFE